MPANDDNDTTAAEKESSTSSELASPSSSRTPLSEIVRAFLYLGVVAFGGPVAHIALMERELIQKRRWLSREHFLDLLAITNLVPGPNSTQMTMHVGFVRRRDIGTWLAGLSFIFPAFVITLVMSWFYATYGEIPAVEALFYGIKPVVVAMIINALWKLGPDAVTGFRSACIFAGALLLSLLGTNELVVMGLGVLFGLLLFEHPLRQRISGYFVLMPSLSLAASATDGGVDLAAEGMLLRLGLLFLRFGATLYGSGYLLIAFIKNDLVHRLGWLSSQQLLDAIAIGQMTPGPILTTSTAVGYITGGLPGAIIATTAIFLPSFFFVMFAGRWMPVLRESVTVRAALKGITPAVIAVMLTVTVTLAREALVDTFTIVMGAGALLALVRLKIDSLILIGGAALLGYAWMILV